MPVEEHKGVVDGRRRLSGFSAVAATLLVVALSGCGDPSGAKALRSVHMGMSEKAVVSILGEPSSYNGGPDIHHTCWFWIANHGQGGEVTINRYEVCFDNGKAEYKRLLD
jgi:outer membrane protein assembly factor BamE (lipoprotein component of BamABCDE complex)